MSQLQMLVERINGNLHAEQVLQMLGFQLDRVEQQGNLIRAFCPIHRDKYLRTLTIEPNQRRFRCSYAKCKGAKGGNLFKLYHLAKGMTEIEAATELAGMFGYEIHGSLEELKPSESAPVIVDLEGVLASEKDVELELLTVPPDVETENELEVLVATAVQNISEDFVAEEEQEEEQVELDLTLSEDLPVMVAGQENEKSPVMEPQLDWDALYQSGMELFEQNRYLQAEGRLVQAYEYAPSVEQKASVALSLGKCYLEGKRPAQTMELLKDAIKVKGLPISLDKSLRRTLSSAFERTGDIANAVETLKAIMALYGDDPDVMTKLRQLEEGRKTQEKAAPKEKRISFL